MSSSSEGHPKSDNLHPSIAEEIGRDLGTGIDEPSFDAARRICDERLDAMIALVNQRREERHREFRKALLDRNAMHYFILKDCANLIAGIGGYAAPIEPREREKWIAEKMSHDPAFRTRAEAVKNLLSEYIYELLPLSNRPK